MSFEPESKPTIHRGSCDLSQSHQPVHRLSPVSSEPLLPSLPVRTERNRTVRLPTLQERTGASGSSSGQCIRVFRERFQCDQRKLLEVTRLITSIQEPQDLFGALIRAAADLAGAERGFLLLGKSACLSEGNFNDLELVAAYRLPPALLGEADFGPCRSAIFEAFRTGETIVRESSDPSLSMRCLGVSAVLVEPIVLQGRVLGVLYLDTGTNGSFRKRHAQMLPSFAAQAAICLENLRLGTERETALRKQHTEEIRSRELQIYKQTTESFMRMASHDLKAPLTVLRTGLACLKRESEPEQQKAILEDLERALARAQRVVSDCLDRVSYVDEPHRGRP